MLTDMTWMNDNVVGLLMKSWHIDWASAPKQTNNWPFLSFLSRVQSVSYFHPAWHHSPGWKWWHAGVGDSDNSDEKGSGRSVSAAKLKCHYASLFLAETAAGICLFCGSFHTKFLSNAEKKPLIPHQETKTVVTEAASARLFIHLNSHF